MRIWLPSFRECTSILAFNCEFYKCHWNFEKFLQNYKKSEWVIEMRKVLTRDDPSRHILYRKGSNLWRSHREWLAPFRLNLSLPQIQNWKASLFSFTSRSIKKALIEIIWVFTMVWENCSNLQVNVMLKTVIFCVSKINLIFWVPKIYWLQQFAVALLYFCWGLDVLSYN